MKTSHRNLVLAIAAIAVIGAGVTAYAAGEGAENDAIADLAKAKISLNNAVATAEAQSGGKATRAELESEKGNIAFEIEVVKPDKRVLDIKVDAVSGKVISSQEDKRDGGKHDDKD